MMEEYIYGCLIENSNTIHFGSHDVLRIYFNQKSIEDRQRMLTDSGFGC